MAKDFFKTLQKKRLAIDFDVPLHSYKNGWDDGKLGEPTPGAKEAMEFLSRKYDLYVYSVRAYDRVINGILEKNQIQEMTTWLDYWGFPPMKIWTDPGKPLFHLLVDDRVLRFESWDSCLPMIEEILSKC